MNITITTIDEEQITENKFIIYKGNILDENLTVWMLFERDGVFYLVEKD